MKQSIIFLIGLFLISTTSIQAQELLKVDEIKVVNTEVNNITIQINTAGKGQIISNKITQSEVNQKTGYTTTLNGDNSLLTLNFTRQFNERELSTLLEYSGIKLQGAAFGQLYDIINQ